MNQKIQHTFLSEAYVMGYDGNQYLVLETCNHSTEMLVLRLANGNERLEHPKAFHYYNGVYTPVDLDKDRVEGCYFPNGVIHNWVEENP